MCANLLAIDSANVVQLAWERPTISEATLKIAGHIFCAHSVAIGGGGGGVRRGQLLISVVSLAVSSGFLVQCATLADSVKQTTCQFASHFRFVQSQQPKAQPTTLLTMTTKGANVNCIVCMCV